MCCPYLGDFLFPPQRANAPVKMLSGGERSRLLLARLFAQPANLLVLDEPTNDLDIESLEILEQTLQEYPGTLLVVSHDRAFLDNVVTQTLVSAGDGHGRSTSEVTATGSRNAPRSPRLPNPPARALARNHLGLGTNRPGCHSRSCASWKPLPSALDALEQEQIMLGERMAAPDYHKQGADVMRKDRARSGEIEALLVEKLERWVELEGRAQTKG
jgi:ATP-binding cassette subfamily F protein uup